VRSGRVNATTLVHFEPVTGESFEPAGRLEMYRSLRGEERRAWQSGTLPVVTALLVGVQVRLWWLGGGLWEFSGFPIIEALLTKWGMRETASIFENGESWRLLTMGFLHTDPLHIAGNTIFLAFTAYNLERTIGRANLVVLYVGAVIAGSVLSSMLGPETPSLGASGGVYGLIAAMVTVAFARPKLLGPRMRVFFLLTSLPYMVLMFLTGLSSERVDNSAHFGGLVTGLVLGLVLAPDVAERRPGDNARARASVLELCMLALVIPVLVGPRIAPLQDAVSRRNNVAYVEALGQRLGLFEADEPAVSRTLHYRVPAAWTSLFDATRATAFVSPLSRGELRAWRVSERSSDDLVDLIELAGEWREDVLDEWPGAIFDPPRASTLAGLDGLQVVGRIGHGAGERILEWRGVARGVSSLQAVWQVDVASAKRLEPLKRRLLNSVRWELPESWREAEIELATFPDSLSRKQEFAREQIRIGNWREGAALLWEVVQADPDAPTTWTSALADLRPALTRLEDPDRWFGAALEHAPVPQVVEEIALVSTSWGGPTRRSASWSSPGARARVSGASGGRAVDSGCRASWTDARADPGRRRTIR